MPITTPTGMLMFPHLFQPRPVVQGGDPRFSLILVFDEAAQKDPKFPAMKIEAAKVCDTEFGAGKSKDLDWQRRVKFSWPFRDASEKDQYAGFEPGKIFMTLWTKTKPGLVDGRNQVITAPADVFAGQLARATAKFFAYQVSGNTGVSVMLDNVQIVRPDMPRMDGRVDATKAFDLVDEEEANTLVGAADDLPF